MQFHAFAFNDTFLWKLENLNIEDMKKILVTILFVTSVMLSLAQTESVKPTLGLELDRKVSVAICFQYVVGLKHWFRRRMILLLLRNIMMENFGCIEMLIILSWGYGLLGNRVLVVHVVFDNAIHEFESLFSVAIAETYDGVPV